MSRPILEVIALGAEDAVAAEAGGADRLELVTDIAADGLTPSLDTFVAVREAVTIPLRVMLRAGAGFTVGDAQELDSLCGRARQLRAEGAEEFVLGFLDHGGGLDRDSVEVLLGAVPGCRWTFHRAIDRAADRGELRRQLRGPAGPDTYLTAGSANGVDDGLAVLHEEAARTAAGDPGHEPQNMIGGGLRLEHVPGLRAAGFDAFHIGGPARSAGWSGPVDARCVRAWRELLDTA